MTTTTRPNGSDALTNFARQASGADIDIDPAKPLEDQIDGERIVARPNGTAYVTRMIGHLTDVEFLRKAADADLNVCLYGPPGTGKTSLCEAAFGEDLITTEFDEGTSTEALVGGYVPTPDGQFQWRYGDLVTAMQTGKKWFGDDITAADPRVLTRLYPAFDGRGQLNIKEHLGETIKAEKGFGAVIAYNPNLLGMELAAPLRSRYLIHVYVGTDRMTMRRAGVRSELLDVAEHMTRLSGEGDGAEMTGDSEQATWSPQGREQLGFEKVAAVFGDQIAAENMLGVCPPESRAALGMKLDELIGDGSSFGILKTTPRIG